MEYHENKSVFKGQCIVALLLLVCIVFAMFCPVAIVSATAGPSTGSGVEDSLYALSTALTGFAANVVGANTNDKHVDSPYGVQANHKLWEMSDNAVVGAYVSAGSTVGAAGAIVGYGDPSRGFVGGLAQTNSQGTTVSGYGSYIGIGDNNKTYAYVRYGRLLNELGLDQVGKPEDVSGWRSIGGIAMLGLHYTSGLLPTLFGFTIDILRFINPFRFLVSPDTYSGVVTGIGDNTSGTSIGNVDDPFGNSGTDINMSTGNQGTDLSNTIEPIGEPGGLLARLSSLATEIYVKSKAIGIILILPLTAAFLIAGYLLVKSGSKGGKTGYWPKIRVWLVRFVFIIIGIPFLGIEYTAMLDRLEESVTREAPSSSIIASSFVDFEHWAAASRLDPPNNVVLVSNGSEEGHPQGFASSDTWRTIRNTVYYINYATDLYDLPANSGMGAVNVDGNVIGYGGYLSGGSWDTENGGYYSASSWIGGSDEAVRYQLFSRLNSLISTYMSGSQYTPSAYSSSVMSFMYSSFRNEVGSSASGDGSANKETIYQMFFDTDRTDDWMNRELEDNAAIFSARGTIQDGHDGASGPEEARWSKKRWNVFNNGSNFRIVDSGSIASIWVSAGNTSWEYDPASAGQYRDSSIKTQIWYKHDPDVGGTVTGTVDHTKWKSGIDPREKGGLSTLAMYNYLCTDFNESQILVYSPVNSSSDYVKQQHYSVNLAGSGIMNILFFVNCACVLSVMVLIALFYCVSMLYHNFKQGFSLLLHIPVAMLGVIRSIFQVILYVVGMIMEILLTVFLYHFACEMAVTIASLLEVPLSNMADNLVSTSAVGGIFANSGVGSLFTVIGSNPWIFAAGIVVISAMVFAGGVGAVKGRRCALTSLAYVRLRVRRMVTLTEMLPVFDAQAAKYKSLYVWDEAREDMAHIKDLFKDLYGARQTAPQTSFMIKGGAAVK